MPEVAFKIVIIFININCFVIIFNKRHFAFLNHVNNYAFEFIYQNIFSIIYCEIIEN